MRLRETCISLFCLFSLPTFASETITYSYDMHGRLIGVASTGPSVGGSPTASAYSFDNADNRTLEKVAPAAQANASSFSIGNASAAPGQPLTFYVSSSGTITTTASVSYTTVPGSAQPGTGYVASSGTLTFGPSDTIKPLTVGGVAGATPGTSFTVQLSNPSAGSTISSAVGTGQIALAIVPLNPAITVAGSTTVSITINQLANMNQRTGNIRTFTPDADALGSATIAGDAQSVSYTAPLANVDYACHGGGVSQNFTFTYTIVDAVNGSTVTGSARITVPGKTIPNPPGPCPGTNVVTPGDPHAS